MSVSRDFLAQCPPLDRMPPEVSAAIAAAGEVRRVRRGEEIFAAGARNTDVHLVRHGAVELRESDGALRSRLGEGEFFGRRSATAHEPTAYRATALEDTVLYRFPAAILAQLAADVPEVQAAFAGSAQRLQHAMTRTGIVDAVGVPTAARTRDLVTRAVVHVEPGATVREAAMAMSARDTSLACVSAGGELLGVVTDHDLRTRVVAAGRDLRTPVGQVMTPQPCTIAADRSGYEAMVVMLENDIRHLPVTDGGRVIGIVSAADLFRDHHSMAAISLAGRVAQAESIIELSTMMSGLPELQGALLRAELPPLQVTHVLTSIVDACTRRLLALAERRLGTPPCGYVWLAVGVQARGEWSVGAGQASALVLEELDPGDEFALADAEQYFSELARRVTSGLEVCGIEQRDGPLAVNPRWRQPIGPWREYLQRWIDEADREELREVSALLDLRALHGDEDLAEELLAQLRSRLRRPGALVRALAANAVQIAPPLGFFRTFVLSRDGEGQKVLDIARGGIDPVVDIARVYGLAAGSIDPASPRRLEAAQRAGLLPPATARDLDNALTLLCEIRLRHRQARRERGLILTDELTPEAMTAFDRGHLKEAFAVVRSAQTQMRQAAESGALG